MCAQAAAAPSEYAAQLAAVPQLSSLGQLFRSSLVALLTEEETEYTVTLVKHIFPAHVVLQFNCTNTVAEQMLENVSIVVDLAEAVGRPMSAEYCCMCMSRRQRDCMHAPATAHPELQGREGCANPQSVDTKSRQLTANSPPLSKPACRADCCAANRPAAYACLLTGPWPHARAGGL